MDRGTQPRPNPTNDLSVERLDSRLDSWKEIAAYLGRSEKTARGAHIVQAEGILRDLQERSEHAYVPPYDFAIVYAGFGEKDRALEWLSRSCKDQDVELVALNTDLELDNLRSDPRFQDLLRCVGLHQ